MFPDGGPGAWGTAVFSRSPHDPADMIKISLEEARHSLSSHRGITCDGSLITLYSTINTAHQQQQWAHTPTDRGGHRAMHMYNTPHR